MLDPGNCQAEQREISPFEGKKNDLKIQSQLGGGWGENTGAPVSKVHLFPLHYRRLLPEKGHPQPMGATSGPGDKGTPFILVWFRLPPNSR